MVDTEDGIHEFIPELDELITEGLLIPDEVQIFRYAANEHVKRPRARP